MIIAPQCRPGSYAHAGHTPACAWPENCYIQWGGRGVSLRRKEEGGSYMTAFFEAFPRNPDTFIRGEGATVAEAEQSAFDKLTRYQACSGHEFERRGYTNGAGFCKHCGMFKSKAFEPLPETEEQKSLFQQMMAKLAAEAAEEPVTPISKEEMETAIHEVIQALARNVK